MTDATNFAPFFWSRDGGDLRTAHFLAVHAMQALGLTSPYPLTQALHWPAESHAPHLAFTMDAAQHALPRQLFVAQSLLRAQVCPAASLGLHTPAPVM